MTNRKLTAKEIRFCENFSESGDFLKAAKAAGYRRDFEKRGRELLMREDIRQEILKLCDFKKQTSSAFARLGYERLAFGSICDAVSLLYLEKPSKEELGSMDLYCVSEIKRPRDGSMEIKFFDRLKALEKLEESSAGNDGEKDKTSPLYRAISLGAAALNSEALKDGD